MAFIFLSIIILQITTDFFNLFICKEYIASWNNSNFLNLFNCFLCSYIKEANRFNFCIKKLNTNWRVIVNRILHQRYHLLRRRLMVDQCEKSFDIHPIIIFCLNACMSNVSPVWILIQRSLKSSGNGNCLNNADGQVITTWFGFDNSPAKVSTFGQLILD